MLAYASKTDLEHVYHQKQYVQKMFFCYIHSTMLHIMSAWLVHDDHGQEHFVPVVRYAGAKRVQSGTKRVQSGAKRVQVGTKRVLAHAQRVINFSPWFCTPQNFIFAPSLCKVKISLGNVQFWHVQNIHVTFIILTCISPQHKWEILLKLCSWWDPNQNISFCMDKNRKKMKCFESRKMRSITLNLAYVKIQAKF